MYVWDETTASRESQEIASYCLRHLQNVTTQSHNFLYIPQDYYDVTGRCRKNNKFILHEMKRENFISEKNLQNAIQKCMRKNTNGEKLYWLKICWMRFCKSVLYTILYKISMEDIKFKTLNLSPTYQGRSKFERIALAPLYNDARSITYEKYKDMEQLLSYIPPVHQEYFKTLPYKEYK
ncbi:Vesicle transport protein SFT2B [Vespula maculifrons]|uniref:Vesicle transport protein SFT2B n=1 Tax=Vespula maculifrons TaxID=7453 RepID=A0ABD2ASL1_VESMC